VGCSKQTMDRRRVSFTVPSGSLRSSSAILEQLKCYPGVTGRVSEGARERVRDGVCSKQVRLQAKNGQAPSELHNSNRVLQQLQGCIIE
jgi:hypothetical protein